MGRPAGRVDWNLDWGKVWKNDRYLIGAPYTGHQLADLARLLAELSENVYKGTDKFTDHELGFRRVASVDGDDAWITILGTPVARTTAAAMIFHGPASPATPAVAVVAVRGTQSLQDAIQDITAKAAEDRQSGAVYHEGFLALANELYVDIRQELEPYCGGDTRIWLTGHSLGGAAAQILAHQLTEDGCEVHGVVTFAAPTPGQDDFVQQYGSDRNERLFHNTHRFVHEFDVVPCLPAGPEWQDVGIRHVTYGGDFTLASDSTLGVKITGENLPAGNPRGNPKCEDEGNSLLNKVDNFINNSVDFVQQACPDSTGARVFWGVVTWGYSEVACTGSEYAQAAFNAAKQLEADLKQSLEGGFAYASHKLGNGYLPHLRGRTGSLDEVGR